MLFGTSAVYHRGNWSPKTTGGAAAHGPRQHLSHHCGNVHAARGDAARGHTARRCARVSCGVGAILGSIFRVLWLGAPRWLYMPLYVAMGWVAIGYIKPFYDAGGPAVVWLIAAGGLCYTVGAVIYGIKWPRGSARYFGFHEIFHSLTIAGFVCHYIADRHRRLQRQPDAVAPVDSAASDSGGCVRTLRKCLLSERNSRMSRHDQRERRDERQQTRPACKSPRSSTLPPGLSCLSMSTPQDPARGQRPDAADDEAAASPRRVSRGEDLGLGGRWRACRHRERGGAGSRRNSRCGGATSASRSTPPPQADGTYDVFLYKDRDALCHLRALNSRFAEVGVADTLVKLSRRPPAARHRHCRDDRRGDDGGREVLRAG